MIDLHTHTDQSDGTATPAALIAAAKALPLEALAITDHDTLAGYDIAVPLAAEAGLELICGIELSTRLEPKPEDRIPGKRAPSVHLLGYFIDAPSPGFREWIVGSQRSRHQRNLTLIARLNSLGVDITLDEVKVIGRNLTGRPHFARILLQKGYVKTNQEAFDKYLADDAEAGVERDEPSLFEGVKRVSEGGGLPVLAHPVRLLGGRDRTKLAVLLQELIAVGLRGIEVFHSEHTPEDSETFASLAREFDLAITGGSDYHGGNKPGIELGTGKGNLHLPYSVLEAIREHAAVAR